MPADSQKVIYGEEGKNQARQADASLPDRTEETEAVREESTAVEDQVEEMDSWRGCKNTLLFVSCSRCFAFLQ